MTVSKKNNNVRQCAMLLFVVFHGWWGENELKQLKALIFKNYRETVKTEKNRMENGWKFKTQLERGKMNDWFIAMDRLKIKY